MSDLICIIILAVGMILVSYQFLQDEKQIDRYEQLYQLRKEVETNQYNYTNGLASEEDFKETLNKVRKEIEILENEIERNSLY